MRSIVGTGPLLALSFLLLTGFGPPSDDARAEPEETVEEETEDTGHVGGFVGGVVGMVQTSAGPRLFHHSELEVRKQVLPRFPEAARRQGLENPRCAAIVTMNKRGRPVEVSVGRCPPLFHAAAEEALLQWRWAPPRDARRKVAAKTMIAVVFDGMERK